MPAAPCPTRSFRKSRRRPAPAPAPVEEPAYEEEVVAEEPVVEEPPLLLAQGPADGGPADEDEASADVVAGAPLAFQSTLGEPVTPVRPVVTDSGEVIAAVPEAVTSLEHKGEGQVDRYEPEGQSAAMEAAAPEPEADTDVVEKKAKEELPARPKSAMRLGAAKKPIATGAGAGAAASRQYAVPAAPAPVAVRHAT